MRLQRAKAALTQLDQAVDYSDLEASWSEFLVATNLVFTKLSVGAIGCPTSESWSNSKLKEAQADGLLSFLRAARNAEEHGLDRSVMHAYQIEPKPGVELRVDVTIGPNGDAVFRMTDPPHDQVRFPLTRSLAAVTDSRTGRTHALPTHHLGQPVRATTAVELGQIVLLYLEKLILEAEGLPMQAQSAGG